VTKDETSAHRIRRDVPGRTVATMEGVVRPPLPVARKVATGQPRVRKKYGHRRRMVERAGKELRVIEWPQYSRNGESQKFGKRTPAKKETPLFRSSMWIARSASVKAGYGSESVRSTPSCRPSVSVRWQAEALQSSPFRMTACRIASTVPAADTPRSEDFACPRRQIALGVTRICYICRTVSPENATPGRRARRQFRKASGLTENRLHHR
jgi:hypothetical protein